MEKMQIDAVDMTRKIRETHAEALRDADREEKIEFYREKARRLHVTLEDRSERPGASRR